MKVTVTAEEIEMLDTYYGRFRRKIKLINQPTIVESFFLKQFWYLLNPSHCLLVQNSDLLHQPVLAARSPVVF